MTEINTFDLEHLWVQVQHAGHVKEDLHTVGQVVVYDMDGPEFVFEAFGVERNVSSELYQMIVKDSESGYMFWDALAMWLNYFHTNQETAHPDDIAWVVSVAQAYINEKQ